MRLFKYLLAIYQYWKLTPLIRKADSDITTGIHPSLILQLMDTIRKERLHRYRIKDGYHVILTTYYHDVETLLTDLEIARNAMVVNELHTADKRLIKKATRSVILVDFLVDPNNYIIPITTVEESLRTSLKHMNELIVAADNETRSYYLRKLTNILRECYVVVEALHQAGELK